MRGIANAVTMSKWSPGSNPGLSAWKETDSVSPSGIGTCGVFLFTAVANVPELSRSQNPAISRDELEVFSTAQLSEGEYRIQRQTRSSRTERFGTGQPFKGLESLNATAPASSPDGLELLLSLDGGIAAVYRTSPTEAFGVPTGFGTLQRDADGVYGAPELSSDCRTVYAVRADQEPLMFKLISATR